MSDERIHKHDWQGGHCKTCGVEQRQAESELAASRGWKHEPVTSEQVKQLLEIASDIKWKLTLVGLWLIAIWITLMLK